MRGTLSDEQAAIKTTIRKFLVDNFLFGDNSLQFSDSDSFLETNLIDSTGIMELVSFIEQNFEITIEDNEILPENLDSLTNVARFVQSKQGT